MNKSIKTSIKSLFILIISLITIIAFNPTSKATDASNTHNVKDIIDKNGAYISWSLENGKYNLKNNYIYCFQKGQNLTGATYIARAKYIIKNDSVERVMMNGGYGKLKGIKKTDTNTINFAKGLAYILSQGGTSGVDDYKNSPSSDTQLALWEYLKVAKVNKWKGRDIFDIRNQLIKGSNGAVYFNDNKTKIVDPSHNENGEYGKGPRESEKAADIYYTALAIYMGKDTYKAPNGKQYSGTFGINESAVIYKLRDQDTTKQQELLYVERAAITDECPVTVKLKKSDFSDNPIKNAKINVYGGNNVSRIEGDTTNLTSKGNGEFGSLKVYPVNSNQSFTLKIKETNVPSGYEGIPGETMEAEVEVFYKPGEGGPATGIKEISSTGAIPTKKSYEIIINNRPKINLNINKLDNLTGKAISNAIFTVEIENVKTIDGKTAKIIDDKDKITDNKYKNENVNLGKLSLKDVTFADVTKPITVILTETEAPSGYKKITAPITFTITRKGTGYVYKIKESGDGKVDAREFSINDSKYISNDKNTININVRDIPVITLGGTVWEDIPGEKADKTLAPDGIKNNEETGLAGVLVQLVGPDGKLVETDIYGNDITKVHTDANGYYEFNNIEKLAEGGYKVRFSYDGINWQETNGYNGSEHIINDQNAVISEAREQNRTETNNRFKTISKDAATSNDKTTTTDLGYDYNDKDQTSKLKVDMDGTNPASEKKEADFRTNAQTSKTYNETVKNISCGLVNKQFDLSASTLVEKAKLTINGQEIEHNEYKDQENEPTVSLYLYVSDYNFRYNDYVGDHNHVKNETNYNDDNAMGSAVTKEDELKVFVTYKIILKNQTPRYDALVDEFVYHYDKDYTIDMDVGAIVSGYKLIAKENGKLTFERVDDSVKLNSGNDNRTEVELTFKIENTEKIKDRKGIEYNNVVEITKYSTVQGGLIDKDSAPDNANITDGQTPEIRHDEDDSDTAQGLNVQIPENKVRSISGTVFEDERNKNEELNSKKDEGEKNVKDVIVQLIEIKAIGDSSETANYYEYIWQETRSGENGEYQFSGYIPGVYIIRFIYGDGTKYEINPNTGERKYKGDKNTIYSNYSNGVIPDEVRTYNGQDYKSTIDEHYNEPWFNQSNYTGGKSIARDNEARRLEVMNYSANINKEKAEKLNSKDDEMLEHTWMAAESSRILVAKDDMTSETPLDTYQNMNFGLAKRPETNIELEKHITGLKLTAKGQDGVETTIVDVKNDIENSPTEYTGVKEGFSSTTATRDNRGWWRVETDIEQYTQGANLEVEYTYVIKNTGKKDYLSSGLINKYNDPETYKYSDVLQNSRDAVRNSMKKGTYSYVIDKETKKYLIGTYLGQWYYLEGTNTSGCAEVPTRIEANGLQEAINNELAFENGGDIFIKVNNNGPEKLLTYDTNGNKVLGADGKPSTEIQTVIGNVKASDELTTGQTDYKKKVTLRKTLSSSNAGELGMDLPSYIAEIKTYSNAAGRKDSNAIPGNLGYVHSDDTQMTMDSVTYNDGTKDKEAIDINNVPGGDTIRIVRPANEHDEFWGESIIITKPTGEDRSFPVTLTIVAISSMAVLGVGIILIKKFVLKK